MHEEKTAILPSIKILPSEKAEIQRLAKQQGRSVSNYMVWMALNGKVTDKR